MLHASGKKRSAGQSRSGAGSWWKSGIRRLRGGRVVPQTSARLRQRGFLLVEAAVAIGIVGTATLAALGFISTATGAMAHSANETTAAWVATSQAEYIGHAIFVPTPGQYPAVPAPGGFAVSNTTAPYPGGDNAIQAVTITVSYGGSQVISVEIVKVDR